VTGLRACALLALFLLAGCGVPSSGSPAAVQATLSPPPTAAPPSTPEAAPNASVYLVNQQGKLVRVRRYLHAPVSVSDVIQAVAAGPTQPERALGLRTALLNPLSVHSALVDHAGNVTLQLSSNPPEVGATEQVLAFAQVVVSVTSLTGIHTVRFTLGGSALAVPRGEGALTTAPLSEQDFASLLPAGAGG
jgi:spore germination protein GerM